MLIEELEESLYSFLYSALDGSEWLASRQGLFTPGKEPLYPPNRRLFGPQRESELLGEKKEFLLLPGLETWTLQPVA
jgi:hypothetical protein